MRSNIIVRVALTVDDTVKRKFSGLIGVQVHTGPPIKIECRTFLLKILP